MEDVLEISSDYESTYEPSFSNLRNEAEFSGFRAACAFQGFNISESPISPSHTHKSYVNTQRHSEKNHEESLDFNTFREDIEEGLIIEQAQLKVKKEQVERAKRELMRLKEESYIRSHKDSAYDARPSSVSRHPMETHMIPPLSIPGALHSSYDVKSTVHTESDEKYDKIHPQSESYLYHKREDLYKSACTSPKMEFQSTLRPPSGRDFSKTTTPSRSRRELSSSQCSISKVSSVNEQRSHEDEVQIDKNLEILSLREQVVELKSKIRLLEQIIRLNNEKHQILDFTNKLHAKMQTHCNIIAQLQSENAKLKTCVQYGHSENTMFDSQDFNSSTISTARKYIDENEKHCLDTLLHTSDLPETLYDLLNQYDIVEIASGLVKYIKSIELDSSMLNRELHSARLNLISQSELREELIMEKAGLEAKCLELVMSTQNTQLRLSALSAQKSMMNASLRLNRSSQSPMRENTTPSRKLPDSPMKRYVRSISRKPATPTSGKFVKF